MTDIHGGGSPIDRTEREMREWLVEQAATGTPELALVGLLTAYGEAIGRLGYVPRRWTDLDAGSRDDRGCSPSNTGRSAVVEPSEERRY